MESYTSNRKVSEKGFLPMIKNRILQVDKERDKILEETLRKIQNRVQRSNDHYNPNNNYQLYPNQIGQFYYNYPYSMGNNRPIRYFYQRPVKLQADNAFIEQKPHIQQTILNNQKVTELNSKAKKWAKPLRMDDLIRAADEVHYPVGQLLSEEEVKKRKEEMESLRNQVDRVDPEKKKQIRITNKMKWNKLSKFRFLNKFYNVMKEFTICSKTLRGNKNLISQANKADFIELTKFMVDKVKGIENFAIDYLTQIFVVDKTLQAKSEDTVFVIKNFIHQLFYELSTNTLKEDIPDYVKKIMLNYITDNKYLPDNFLTTFEFNRLEFNLGLKLTEMRNDRQAMMVGFILLYRILILEILTNYQKYFPRLANLNNKNEEESISTYQNKVKKNKSNNKKIVEDNVKYNMSFIISLLNSILKDAFLFSPKIYREHFKDTHMYRRFVIDGESLNSLELIQDKLKKDENEFISKIKQPQRVAEFVKDNFRWVNMYKMSAFSFCVQIVENITN